MKRTLSVIITFLVVCAGWTQDVPTYEPLPPNPLVQPLVPGKQTVGEGDSQAQLLDRVERRVLRLERHIADILRQHGDRLPTLSLGDLPELEEERQLRNQSWADLRDYLDRQRGGLRHTDNDPLNHPPRVTLSEHADPEVVSIRLHNRLRMAQCAFELYLGSQGSGNLDQTDELLTALDPKQLPASLQPEWYYLRVAVAVERARLAANETERVDFLAVAQQRLTEFQIAYPDHLRANNAALLIDQLELGGRVDAVRLEAGL